MARKDVKKQPKVEKGVRICAHDGVGCVAITWNISQIIKEHDFNMWAYNLKQQY